MSELQQFIAMLNKAGIGHGKRIDYNPNGTGVQVECENTTTITDWWFDADGNLKEVVESTEG